MKKKISALLLALGLLLTFPCAQAVQGPGRQRAYDGEFSDLTAASPFYDNVTALYEFGLSNGKADGTFGLQDPLTVGQVVIFAGRVRSLYLTGDPEAGPAAYDDPGDLAALPYLHYLQAEDVLGTELDDSLTAAATRAQVAHVLANALPEEVLPSIHDELIAQSFASRRYIPDVNRHTPYYQDILALYCKGVSMGSNAFGAFLPSEPITRGAAAAMLTRMADPALRVQPQWSESDLYIAAGTTLADLVEPGTYFYTPSAPEELENSIRYMLSRGENQLELYFPGLSEDGVRQVMERSLTVMKALCEQGYNEVHCTWSADLLTLNFTAAGAGQRLEEYRSAAMEAAIAVHDQMWSDGVLRPDMTEMEKARVYYEWICSNCAYDYRAGDDSLSHIPYNLFVNHTAVCDGYTGAYNLLLKLDGIACSTVIGGSHIWTAATLDGVQYHIDTTWGSVGSSVNYDYFAMTPEQSRSVHPW